MHVIDNIQETLKNKAVNGGSGWMGLAEILG
jgi:hypothetical protein